MGLSCLFGHDWQGCKCTKCGKTRDDLHDWNEDCEKCANCGKELNNTHVWKGCKCLKCGRIRDEAHDWDKDCEKCSICGSKRMNTHNWSKDCEVCSICGSVRINTHNWSKDCEECSICGKKRVDKHNWDNNCERCSICGAIRHKKHDWKNDCEECEICGYERDDSHNWDGCKCTKCKQIRDEAHNWDGCKCTKCDSTRNKHKWSGFVCSTCGSSMDSYDVSQLITNAISNNDIKFVEDAFVQYNDKINKETYEWPILVRVADKGSLDMLNVILKHKQNIDIAIPKRNDFVGFRAMHFAILRLDIEIVKSLVDAGADINMPISNVSAYNANIAGVTPLQFQMRLKADQIFALKLLELGASPFIFKENLETPIDYAREYKWADFLKVIANHNPKVSKIQITINSHFFHHCSHFEIAAIYATEDTKKPFKKIVLEKLTDIDPETPIKIPRSIPILYANDGFAQSIQIEVSENGVCRCSTWLHQSVIDKAKPKDQITNEVVGGSSQMDFTFTFI